MQKRLLSSVPHSTRVLDEAEKQLFRRCPAENKVGYKNLFCFLKWIISLFNIHRRQVCVVKEMLCGAESWGLWHERTAFYQWLFSGFLFMSEWWRWGELFSPQAAQLRLVCWQRTGDSSNFLIQHFSDASWRNLHPGSSRPFFVVSFCRRSSGWGAANVLSVQLTQCVRRVGLLLKSVWINHVDRHLTIWSCLWPTWQPPFLF